jgi:hypothetical protein
MSRKRPQDLTGWSRMQRLHPVACLIAENLQSHKISTLVSLPVRLVKVVSEICLRCGVGSENSDVRGSKTAIYIQRIAAHDNQ